MALIKEEDISQVRDRINIVDVISDYISLKKAGRSFKGLCPFHKEKTPSFIVDPEKQLFHCFGCDEGGNVFNFLMKIDHMDFATAVETVAKKAGYSLTYLSSPESKKRKRHKDSLYDINEEALNFYHDCLMKSPQANAARQYLKGRGYGQTTAKTFKIGYAPLDNSFTQYSLKKGSLIKNLSEAGLSVEGRNGYLDRFRGRIIFPIADIKGRWIGFGGRVLNPDQQPKYVNSPETSLFSKGKNFYALNWSKSEIVREGFAIIVEGYTDVISLHKAGFKNAVATLGTALTEDHLTLLSRFTNKGYLTFDSDEAGAKAAARVIDFADKSNVELFICILPKGYDPADFVDKKKPEELKKLLEHSKPIMEFSIDRIIKENGFETVKQKEKSMSLCFDLISKVTNEVSRQEYLKYLSEKIKCDLDMVMAEFRKIKKTFNKNITEAKIDLSPEQKVEIELLRAILNQPQLINKVKNVIKHSDFIDENHANIFTLLISTKITEPAELISTIENEQMRKITNKLLMSPVVLGENGDKYIEEIAARIKELNLKRNIRTLKTELEKLNPVKFPKKYDSLFKELVELEAQKRKYAKVFQGG